MRTVYRIIGYSLGACVPAAFVYGFWLIHHGLGLIMGAVIAACYINYYSAEQRVKRKEAADRLIQMRREHEEMRASVREQISGADISENLRRRGVN